MDSAPQKQPSGPRDVPDIKAATALLIAYLPIYDSYHNQKEAIAFAFTAFYIGGASALLAIEKPFWREYDRFMLWSFEFLIIAAGVLGLIFVRWLFRLRRCAGVIYQACSTILTRWSANPPDQEAIAPTAFPLKDVSLMSGFFWPRDLAVELQTIYMHQTRFWLPRDISCLAILFWTLAVIFRVYMSLPH